MTWGGPLTSRWRAFGPVAPVRLVTCWYFRIALRDSCMTWGCLLAFRWCLRSAKRKIDGQAQAIGTVAVLVSEGGYHGGEDTVPQERQY